jgi:hypothetical protein
MPRFPLEETLGASSEHPSNFLGTINQHLKVRLCLIDGERLCCDERACPVCLQPDAEFAVSRINTAASSAPVKATAPRGSSLISPPLPVLTTPASDPSSA